MNKDGVKKGLKNCMFSCSKGCPYYFFDMCHDTLCEDALNLINEQEEEIGRLKDENERFENNMKAVLEKEKKQAVKEFAEKLKAKAVQEAEVEDYVCYIVNRLLKEYEK